MQKKERHNFFGARKHDEETVDLVIRDRKNGMILKDIAEKHGITIAQVNGIFQRPSRK